MKYRRERIFELNLPYRHRLTVERSVYSAGVGPRLAVVAGVHGDEPEGLAVCHHLARWLEDAERQQPGSLRGWLELYPALNPLAVDAQSHELPLHGADLNRSFPGHETGDLPQRLAAAAQNALRGCDLVVALHAGSPHLHEHPQVRLHPKHAAALRSSAESTGLDVIWTMAGPPVGGGSLAYCCNENGTPCLALVAGRSRHFDDDTAEPMVQAVLRLLLGLGIVVSAAELTEPRRGARLGDRVCTLDVPAAGLFLSDATPGPVDGNTLVGTVVSPFSAESLAEVRAPGPGFLFSLRRYPLVFEGTVVARIALDP